MLDSDERRSGRFGMMPNEDPDYGDFVICATISVRIRIAEIELIP